MKLRIEITIDNAAFGECPDMEAARILRDLADRIDGHPNFSPGHEQALRDLNGNEVGYASVYA